MIFIIFTVEHFTATKDTAPSGEDRISGNSGQGQIRGRVRSTLVISGPGAWGNGSVTVTLDDFTRLSFSRSFVDKSKTYL